MVKKIYILVANASEAYCYESTHLGHDLSFVKEFTHPESREKGRDLETDAPGHYHTRGSARGAFVSHSTPHEIEAEHFALELAGVLHAACNDHLCDELIVIAPARFCNLLNKHCSEQVLGKVMHTLDKDYTKIPQKQLQVYLGELAKKKIPLE